MASFSDPAVMAFANNEGGGGGQCPVNLMEIYLFSNESLLTGNWRAPSSTLLVVMVVGFMIGSMLLLLGYNNYGRNYNSLFSNFINKLWNCPYYLSEESHLLLP